ncbi:hypothetical protein PVAND_012989 [Polypedilum vanderplanki]|uniref:SSD domain-containing protein n=1 Tax=Polypedilum vanderplanki TaxID=319348 RepID=A0A9J6CP97_POLVA|nr:hypothetical protein PVAND_012989 [Polypedilum vanderplanki]
MESFLNFHQERDPIKLWVPDNIDFHKHTKFIMNNYKEGVRAEAIMIISDNVLRPEVFEKLHTITEKINQITIKGDHGENLNLTNLCFKIPLIIDYANLISGQKEQNNRKRRAIDNDYDQDYSNENDEEFDLIDMIKNHPDEFMKKITDPSFKFTTKQYCSIVNKLKLGCMHENPLEMWSIDNQFKNLTKEDILNKLHTTKINQVTGHEMNFTSMLSGIEHDSDGRIVSAKAILAIYNLRLNFSEVDLNQVGNDAATQEWTTVKIMQFEEKFLLLMEELKNELENDNLRILYGSGRSYGDISSKALFQDIEKLFVGIVLMMIYMALILSKFSWPEMRIGLTCIGILNVGMAYISGCGLSSIFLFYSPVHASLFFIILGLGVDDIFVIMSAFRKINADHSELNLEEKVAKAMQKAGASITITSLTDIIAFVVGATTVLPSLRSFCIFAGVCITMTYIYVVTFFVAVLTIDERRTLQNRNGIVPCIKHKDHTPSCEPKIMWRFLHFFYGKIILTKLGKILVLLTVVGLTGFSIDRILLIKQKFDPIWFIPTKSYFYEFWSEYRKFYPERGYEAGIYIGNLNYSANLQEIIMMAREVESRNDIVSRIQSWPNAFHNYMLDSENIDVMEVILNETQWNNYLSKFLFSIDGGKYQANLKFKDKLECGKPAGEILISSIIFKFHTFDDRDEFLPAKATLEKIIHTSNLSTDQVFVWGRILGNWFTDEIIDEEIYRNIILALVGVFVCTAVMIVNAQVCFYIFICVLLSLISVGGFMQVWGLTLDIVTSIGLQLSIGLCVDYAAHIGHTFLTISHENGNKRALETVETICGAVLQGGGSTALSIMILSTSDAYTFKAFFKIFTIVVIFGLFYGTVFLPVILSIFQPNPYSSINNLNNNNNNNKEDNETELMLMAKQARLKIISQNGKNNNSETDKLN